MAHGFPTTSRGIVDKRASLFPPSALPSDVAAILETAHAGLLALIPDRSIADGHGAAFSAALTNLDSAFKAAAAAHNDAVGRLKGEEVAAVDRAT